MTPAKDPLLELFRDEVNIHLATVAEGLAASRTTWPAYEKAAQGMRSAALIVEQPVVADLARQLETVFSDVRRKGTPLSPELTADVSARLAEIRRLLAIDPTPTEEASSAADAIDAVTVVPTVPPPVPPPPVPPPPVPPPPPPPPPPRASIPEAGSLLELFREEVKSLCGLLSDGLVELEADPTDPRRIEPLMRAAHSMKGAARIVNVEPAVALTHEMEELLVSAQKGELALAPSDIDSLLSASDLLSRLATVDLAGWSVEHAERVSVLQSRFQARLQGEPPPAPTVNVAAAPAPAPAPAPAQAPAPAAVVPAQVPAAEPAEPRSAPQAGGSEPPAKDPVVRISAASLSRLLSLAGESLVEARWLQPFSRSLFKLKKQQDHLAEVLEDLCRVLAGNARHDRAAETAEDARERLLVCRNTLAERVEEFESHARQSDDLNSRLYREVIASRMRPFGDGTQGFGRMVRDVARQLGKKVKLEVVGQDTDVDRDILDKLDAPLGHILRNAVDHGLELPAERVAAGKPETGTIRVEARHHAGMLNVTVSEDGRGIDLDRLRRKVVEKRLTTADLAGRLSEGELLEFLFLPGFSTKETVSDVSGRGVGLDVVQAMAQAVGGIIRVSTKLGQGTTFDLQLPITLSVVRAVLVTVSGDPFALPLNRTDRLLRLTPDQIRTLEGKPHFEADGKNVGLVPAYQVFDLPPPPATDDIAVVLIGDRNGQYGLIVDGFLGEQDLVVRPLDPRLGKVPNVSAASLLDDGSPVLIVDVEDLARSVAVLVHDGKLRHQRLASATGPRKKRVLVVDDSAMVREVERQILFARGYEVDVAVDGADGWNAVRTGSYDLIVSDIDMPRMTGLEFVRAIRSDPRVQFLPVVIVSYKDRPEDRTRGLDAGANYYLTKSSFHDGSFVAAVIELIGEPND